MEYQLLMGYLMPKFDSFVNDGLQLSLLIFGLTYLFNGISTPYGLFNAEI